MKSSGDHKMNDQPQVIFQSDGDALANSPEFTYRMPVNGSDGRLRGAQDKGVGQADSFKGLTRNARFERAQIGIDIREFGHFKNGCAGLGLQAIRE